MPDRADMAQNRRERTDERKQAGLNFLSL